MLDIRKGICGGPPSRMESEGERCFTWRPEEDAGRCDLEGVIEADAEAEWACAGDFDGES